MEYSIEEFISAYRNFKVMFNSNRRKPFRTMAGLYFSLLSNPAKTNDNGLAEW